MGNQLTVTFHDHRVAYVTAKKPKEVECSKCRQSLSTQIYFQCGECPGVRYCEDCVAVDAQCDSQCRCHVEHISGQGCTISDNRCCANPGMRLPTVPESGNEPPPPAYYDLDNGVVAPTGHTQETPGELKTSLEDEQEAVLAPSFSLDTGGSAGIARSMTISTRAQIQLASQDGRTVPCPLCFADVDPSQAVRLRGCKHFLCGTCLGEYMNSCLKDISKYPVRCPLYDCDVEMNYQDVQMVLSQEQLATYDKFVIQAACRSGDTNAVSCVNPQCQHVLVIEKQEVRENPRRTCPFCNTVMCVSCATAWHANRTCAQRKAEAKRADQWEQNDRKLQSLMAQEHWQRCPACQTPIEKTSGCNHMTHKREMGCTKVVCHFCAQCGIELSPLNHRQDIEERPHLTKGYFGDCVVTVARNAGREVNLGQPNAIMRTLTAFANDLAGGAAADNAFVDQPNTPGFYLKVAMIEWVCLIDILMSCCMTAYGFNEDQRDARNTEDAEKAQVPFNIMGMLTFVIGLAYWIHSCPEGTIGYRDNWLAVYLRMMVQGLVYHLPTVGITVSAVASEEEGGFNARMIIPLIYRVPMAFFGVYTLVSVVRRMYCQNHVEQAVPVAVW